MTLSNFRWFFIDAQNKAGFFKAAKGMVTEFRKLQMEEKMENQLEDEYITLRISKKQIVFFWHHNNDSRVLVLNKEGENFTLSGEEIKLVFIDTKIADKISIYDSKIISALIKLIGDIFTGKSWSEIYKK